MAGDAKFLSVFAHLSLRLRYIRANRYVPLMHIDPAPARGAVPKGQLMMNARGIARLGMLAVGLGVGVAVASTPGIARADDFQISIDGHDLFSTAGNTATAYSGTGDIAIAYGDGATASALGGTGDYALASGSDAAAYAGGASGDTGADNDRAVDIGNNTGSDDGSFAGNSDLVGATDGGTGSDDTATDIGNNSGPDDGSFAGAGALHEGGLGNGNGDTASYVGNNANVDDGSSAIGGNDNYASVSGDNSGVFAGEGNNNIAEVVGPDSGASAGSDGSNNIGYVFDPFGTQGSFTEDGFGGNSDLGAVFGDNLYAGAGNGSFLYDIVSPAGDLPGSAAATSGGFLAELLSLF
jgi:hypothetical protein